MNKHGEFIRQVAEDDYGPIDDRDSTGGRILDAADEIDRIEAENTELRHALTDARAVIAEIVDRVQPLVPFILAESERLRR
jgi:hypothetical protein